MFEALDTHFSQEVTGSVVGISARSVRRWEKRLDLPTGYTIRQFLTAYFGYLRQQIVDNETSGGHQLAQENARLAKERADKLAMENEARREELAPTHVIEHVVDAAGKRISQILGTIPGKIRNEVPALSDWDIAAITKAVGKVQALVQTSCSPARIEQIIEGKE